MKLFLLADLHLGANCSEWGRHASKRQEDLRKAWDEAVYLAASENVDAFIVAGDLFTTSEPEGQDLVTVLEGLERLTAKGKQVVLLPGIYDGAFTENAFYNRELPEGVTAVTWSQTRCVEIPLDDQILFVHTRAPIPGFDDEPVMVEERMESDGIHVGLTYQLPKAIASMSSDRSLEGLDIMITGGGHDYARSARDGVSVISPGSPVGLGGKDSGDRAWTVVEISDKEVEVHPVACDTPVVLEEELDVTALGLSTPQSLSRHLREHMDECSLLSLRIVGSTEERWEESELQEALEDLPFVVNMTNATTAASPGGEQGTEGRFCREMEARREAADPEDKTLFDLALRLGLKELRRREESHAD